jgi:hypothetical protein
VVITGVQIASPLKNRTKKPIKKKRQAVTYLYGGLPTTGQRKRVEPKEI